MGQALVQAPLDLSGHSYRMLILAVIRYILRNGVMRMSEGMVRRMGWRRRSGWRLARRVDAGEASARGRRRGGWRGVSRGQALVEFALVAPIFFLLIFGVIEFSLINASIGAYNFAAKDAARLGSIRGPTDANIDQEIVSLVNSHVNAVPAATTLEIDIFQANSDGSPVADSLDAYTPAGVAIGTPGWPYNDRDDGQFITDPQQLPNGVNPSPYLGVRVIYNYTYVTALLSSGAPVIRLTATAVFRIEPQESTSYVAPSAAALGSRRVGNSMGYAPAFPDGFAAFSAASAVVPIKREAR